MSEATDKLTFLQMLAAHRTGGTAEVLTEHMQDMIAHLQDLQLSAGIRKAKATLTLTVEFENDDGVLKVLVKPKVKLPDAPLAAAVFWMAPNGGLVQQDPRQRTFKFTDVTPGRRIVDIGDDAGRDR